MAMTRMEECICDGRKWRKGVPKPLLALLFDGRSLNRLQKNHCTKMIDMTVISTTFGVFEGNT